MPLPTPQQRAVLDAVRDDRPNLAVNAVAGAGKTTTIVGACRAAGAGSGFVAFNSHIVEELRTRLGAAAQASTLHSLGFRCLTRAFPSIRKDDRKVKAHLERLYPHLHREGRGKWAGRKFIKNEWRGLADAVSVIRQANCFPSEDLAAVEAACWAREVELPTNPADRTKFFELAEETAVEVRADTAACDFDDMIWMPVQLGLARPQFSTLFVDETQDLSPVQQALALASGDRLVIVGDPNQSIMGFAGADAQSFDRLTRRLGEAARGARELPLSHCFRCPESHIRLAALLVPRITTAAFADEGEARDAAPAELLRASRPGDMVLCRATVPLIRLATRFIAQDTPVLIRGRAIGEDLESLLAQLAPSTPADLAKLLDLWLADQVEKLEAADAPDFALERARDRAVGLGALAFRCDTIAAVRTRLSALFGDDKASNRVLLSTVHRSKGLEAERVWLYEPGLMPGRGGGQELNVLYVALTRAKQSLFFVDDEVRRADRFDEWVRRAAEGCTRADLTEHPTRDEEDEPCSTS